MLRELSVVETGSVRRNESSESRVGKEGAQRDSGTNCGSIPEGMHYKVLLTVRDLLIHAHGGKTGV